MQAHDNKKEYSCQKELLKTASRKSRGRKGKGKNAKRMAHSGKAGHGVGAGTERTHRAEGMVHREKETCRPHGAERIAKDPKKAGRKS